jgi:transcriptional regulator GlxA family with amidase domain
MAGDAIKATAAATPKVNCTGGGIPLAPRAGVTSAIIHGVSRAAEESNRRMLRARDAMDRDYAQPLDIPRLAKIAYVSEAHFIRVFRATFGETPHRYLQRRRVERAMFLLRETDRSVTEICFDVGFSSLGTFSRTFTQIVGEPPTTYRWRAADLRAVPACFAKAWTRPSSFGEAKAAARE